MVGLLTERAKAKNALRVARWRKAGMWKSSFPDELVHIEKRLSWEFWFTQNGTLGPAFRTIAEAGVDDRSFVSFHLPHKVEYEAGEGGLPNKWMSNHLLGVWQYFAEGQKHYLFFEFPEDAFHFKMAH